MIDRRHALAWTAGLALRPSLASPPAPAWWRWGPGGVQGTAGFHPWPAPPPASPQAGAGALWWWDASPALHRLALDGTHRQRALPAAPSAWAPAPRGEGVVLAFDLAHGPELWLLDPLLAEAHRWPLRDLAGRQAAIATHLVAHEARRSLLAAVPGLGEVWELSLDPEAPHVFDGLVHDHRMGEAIARPGHFGVRRVPLRERGEAVPSQLHGAPGRPWVYGPVPGGVAVLNLDVRRRLVTLPASFAPSGALHAWQPDGGWLWLQQGAGLQAFDAQRWRPGPDLPLPAEGVQLLAEGPRLWLRDAGDRLWRGAAGGNWVRQGTARAMALAPNGALGTFGTVPGEQGAAGPVGLQPAW